VSGLAGDARGACHCADSHASGMAADDQRSHDFAFTLKLKLCFFANAPVLEERAEDFLRIVEPLWIVRQADTKI
jgi:hypothetical protein